MWARAHAALATMEIDHLKERPVTEMSTGELRRVLIARALVPDPQALLLDEPTTGLDLVTRQRFLESLRRVAATKTIILVTHHVEEIIPEIQRVVLLRDGRIHEEGTKRAILTSEKLSAAFGAGVEVERSEDGYYSARVNTSAS
jgi:iron complex transport system ATP-binding protein